MRGILLLDDYLIGECNDLAGAALEQVSRLGETVGGFFLSGGESGSGVLLGHIGITVPGDAYGSGFDGFFFINAVTLWFGLNTMQVQSGIK